MYMPGAPHFTYRPRSITVLSGSMAVLFCAGSGSPAPTVSWFRLQPTLSASEHRFGQEVELVADERVLISELFLVLTEVQLSDEGFYFCSISSPLASSLSNKVLFNVYSES